MFLTRKVHSGLYGAHIGKNCFYCSKPVVEGDAIVHWQGPTEEISLHQPCARSLALHLVKDSFGIPGDSYMGA